MERVMKRVLCGMVVAGLALFAPVAMAGKESNAEKRAEIDKVSKEALEEILGKAENAKKLYDQSYGYAVFDNMRITFIFSGGGGSGVAVNKGSGKRTYMKMGTGGISFGIGAQKYQVIMFFEDEETLDDFIEHGWKAETSASAAAGTSGANVGTGFVKGIALFQITEAGLMASADISGTKYTVNKKLNEQ